MFLSKKEEVITENSSFILRYLEPDLYVLKIEDFRLKIEKLNIVLLLFDTMNQRAVDT